MSKGESDFGVVAIKSKGGDCWHYDACVVLDGNPLIEEHLTYILSAESTEEISNVTYYIDAGQFKGIKWQVLSKLCHQVQKGRLLAL